MNYQKSIILLAATMALIAMLALSTYAQQPNTTRADYDCNAQSEIAVSECEALVALYNATGGEYWIRNDGWLQTNTPCSWDNVDCEGYGWESWKVYSLNLSGNSLSGAIPAEIGQLTNLRYLYLNNNSLTSLPSEIGNLVELRSLDISYTNITSLPADIGNLSLLGYLDIAYTNITSLPAEIGNLTALTSLNAYGGKLQSLPSTIGGMTNLTSLNLSNNALTELPAIESGDLPSLTVLYLNNNNLTSLPEGLGHLVKLSTLELMNNPQLSGEIPVSIGNLTKLTRLQINAHLTGTIPSTIGNMKNLQYLDLLGNSLEGEIPTTMGDLPLLKILNLEGNMLSGTVPATLANTPLQELYLGFNQFDDFGAVIPSLQTVSLKYNRIEPTLQIGGWLASLDPYWYGTQVYPPENLQADFSTYLTDGRVRMHWKITGVSASGELFCGTSSGVTENNYAFKRTGLNEIYLTGYPDGTYYCKVRSYLTSWPYSRKLTSRLGDEMFFVLDGSIPATNDKFANAVNLGPYYLYQEYSASIVNAKRESKEPTPSCVTLNGATARSIYFSIADGGPFDPNIYGEKITKLESSNTGTTRITLGVYEGHPFESPHEVACATGEPGSSTLLEVFTEKGKDYTLIVWADEPSGVLFDSMGSQFTLTARRISMILYTYGGNVWRCSQSTVSLTECDALVRVFYTLGGMQWASTTDDLSAASWFRYEDACQWHGLTCEGGNVTGIDLSNQGLYGELPDVFVQLNKLKMFDISGNWVYGDIPYSLIALTFLNGLDFSYNAFDTTDPAIAEFIARFDPDWAQTQTIVANGSFEGKHASGVPVVWKGTNTTLKPGKDRQKCNNPDKTFAHTGDCAFMFKGNVNGGLSRIKQRVFATSTFKHGAQVTLSAYIKPSKAPAGIAFSKFIVKYSDGTKNQVKLRIPEAAGYTQVSDYLTVNLINGRYVEKVLVEFRYNQTSGKFFLDDVMISVRQPDALLVDTTEPELLPVPEAPPNFRR